MSGFEALFNFRDFGGYPAAGGTVATGRLFRSAAPHALTPGDLDRLGELGIGAIVDLRRWSERQAAPSDRWDGFSGSVIEAIEQDVMAAPHDRYLGGESVSRAILRERVLQFYAEAPFDPRHLDLFGRAFATLAETEGAVHIHCAVGKDRTGILVALIQHALGVGEDDQMREYLLTARERRMIDWLNARAIAAAEAQGKTLTAHDAEALTNVDPDYLETARAAMRERCGSVDGYLAQIGVSAARTERLRARLVA